MIPAHHRLIFCAALFLFVCVSSAAGATLNVSQDFLGQQYPNYSGIQEAIGASHDGDIIRVGPGEYNERITIDRSIVLEGATAGISKKDYPLPGNYAYDNTTESIIVPRTAAQAPVIAITKGNVTLDGFIVSMTVAPSPVSDYPLTNLIQMFAAGNLNNVTIRNNVLGPNTNLTTADGNSGRMAIAISKWNPNAASRQDNAVHNLKIQNNMIFDATGDGCGILIIGEKNLTGSPALPYQYSGSLIDNNTISGNHRSGIDLSGAVQGGPADTDHLKITRNRITGNGWNSTVDKDDIKWGNGIVLIRMTNDINNTLPVASRYIDIENNEFSENEKNAIYAGPINRDIAIENNVIRNNGRGTSPGGVAGFSRWDGIRIDLDERYQIEELARHPADGPWSGLKIYEYLRDINIHENDISGNGGTGGYGLRVIGVPKHGAIDARKNWWGDESGPFNLFSNRLATGDAVSNFVRYTPWYREASRSTPVTPPSGSGLTLYVGYGNYTTIQEAINAAEDGDTIRVSPGLRNERIVINKSLTLLGATNGVSKKDYVVPPDYAYDTTMESVIHPSADQKKEVVEITAGNVTFDGFVVAHTAQTTYSDTAYPVTHLIGLSNQSADYSGVAIRNNVIGPNTNTVSQDGRKGRAGIAVYGPNNNNVHDLAITGNRIFDAKGDGCGIMLLGSVNTTTPGLAGKYAGSLIDNNTITGNHRSGIELSGGVQGSPSDAGHVRITNNTIAGNGWNSPADKDNVTFGNGIVLIHVRSDKENPLAWGSGFVDIGNNQITGNEKNGIYIGPVNRNITIRNNTIRDNGANTQGDYEYWDGIRVDLDEKYHDPQTRNYGFLANITLRNNEINASGNYGARVIGIPANGPIDARLNYWGRADGPRGPSNPEGSGNPVSDYLVFSPWYQDPSRTVPGTMYPEPVASFTGTPVSGYAPLAVTFTDTSTGMPDSWLWDFGDGDPTNATQQNPVHRFASAARYTVRLTVTNSTTGSNTTVKNNYIVVNPPVLPPVANFTGSPTSGPAPLAVTFTDRSTGDITSWIWDAGDDGSVECTTRDCRYTFERPGTYAVKLVVSNDGGFDTMIRTDYIIVRPPPPAADFSASPVNGSAPLTVTFTDISEGVPTAWLWNFGDNDATNATARNPVHQYRSPGVYTVQLRATNESTGANTTIKRNYIAVATAGVYPVPSFSWSPFEGMIGDTFSFDASDSALLSKTGIRSYRWDFGDGNTTAATADPKASHTFSSSRVYTVTLFLTDQKGLSNQTHGQISVIAKKESVPISFNGTNVSGAPGSQVITINATASGGTVTNTTTGVTITNPGNGWADMEVRGNTSVDAEGKLVVSNISEVILRATPSVTQLGSGAGSPGDVSTSIELALKQLVEAPLEVEVTEGVNATIFNGFQLGAGAGNQVDAVAYTMTIKGSSLVNSNLSASGEPVRLNMSVSRDWVDSHGGIDAIKVLRYSDDGATKETLGTHYLFTAGTPAMCYFEIISPHGLSIFGIASVVPAPPSPAPVPGNSYSSSGIASTDSGMPGGTGTRMKVTTVPATPVPSPSRADKGQPGIGQPQPLPAAGTVPPAQETVPPRQPPKDMPGYLLFFVEENILKMGIVAGATCIGLALVIWYNQQTRWE